MVASKLFTGNAEFVGIAMGMFSLLGARILHCEVSISLIP